MRFDTEQAVKFFESLTGNTNAKIQFQIFHDQRKRGVAQTWFDSLLGSAPALRAAQTERGCGVFFTVNETDGRGRELGNITAVRACFLDFDEQTYPESWPIIPSWIVGRSATQFHVYFLLQPGQDLAQWPLVQYHLALYYGTRDKLHDLPRVMRVPGFYNLKTDTPALYDVQYHNPVGTRYTLQQLIDAHPLTDVQQRQLDAWASSPILSSGVGLATDAPLDAAADVLRYRQWLARVEPPAVGDRNNAVFRVAAMAKDYALSISQTAAEVERWRVEAWANPGDAESVQQAVFNAYRYGRSAPGSQTAAAAFQAAPEAEIPPEAQAAIIARALAPASAAQSADAAESAALAGAAYGKNHTINAGIFLDAAKQNGVHFCTVRQETFVYTGTHWRRMDLDSLEALVMRAMIDARPNIDCVRGTAKILRLITCDSSVMDVPAWIGAGGHGTDGHKAGDIIPFKNGLLDVRTGELLPHTREFFHTYSLGFNYDEHAPCDNWVRYLRETFHDDEGLVHCLQEWFGYQLVATYEFQKIAMFLGAPRSGKGTITQVLTHIVGESNIAAPRIDALNSDPILDLMSDKPVAIIGDAHTVHFTQRASVLGILKTISGGDRVTYNRKFISSVSVRLPTRFTICANSMPDFLDPSGAFAGRLLLFPFRTSHMGREDTGLLPRLLQESSGIINWAIAGLNRLRHQRQFTRSVGATHAALEVSELVAPVSAFIADCLRVTCDHEHLIPNSAMLHMYRMWCASNEILPFSPQRFKLELLAAAHGVRFLRPSATVVGSRERSYSGVMAVVSFDGVSAIRPMPSVGG